MTTDSPALRKFSIIMSEYSVAFRHLLHHHWSANRTTLTRPPPMTLPHARLICADIHKASSPAAAALWQMKPPPFAAVTPRQRLHPKQEVTRDIILDGERLS